MALEHINRYRNAELGRGGGKRIGLDLLAPHNWTLDPITGCYLWNWTVNDKGYAQVRHSAKLRRVTNILAGTVGMGRSVNIRHEAFCDKSCINPEHLTVGTESDNMIDRTIDGDHGLQVLTAEQAYQIKFQELDNGQYRYLGHCRDLALKYGVSRQIIYNIKSGRRWNWLRPDMDISELRRQRPGTY